MDNLPEDRRHNADFTQGDTVLLLGAEKPCDAKQRADRLGNHRGQGRAAHIAVEHRYENHVQHGIDHGREDQVVKRVVTVPHRLHDAAAAVVEGGGDCAGKVNAQIYGRLGEDFLRCAHEAQNVIRKHRAHQCEHRPCQKGEGQVGMDRLGELLPVAGAEIPRHRHARADEHTLHKADQHKNKRPHRAHRRQSRVSQHVAHDQRVHRAVELLEQVADEKGHRKADNLSADGPFRHPDG